MIKQSISKHFLYSLSFISYFIVTSFYADVVMSASSNLTINERHKAVDRTTNYGQRCETEEAGFDEDILIMKNKRYKAVDGVV